MRAHRIDVLRRRRNQALTARLDEVGDLGIDDAAHDFVSDAARREVGIRASHGLVLLVEEAHPLQLLQSDEARAQAVVSFMSVVLVSAGVVGFLRLLSRLLLFVFPLSDVADEISYN